LNLLFRYRTGALLLTERLGHLYAEVGWPLKGLSRMTVTCHVRFLGGLGLVTAPGYPVFADIWRYLNVFVVPRHLDFLGEITAFKIINYPAAMVPINLMR
jgi:hypothetical protein